MGGGYPASDAIRAEHVGWLSDLGAVPGTVRDRYYETGAGVARLLDRLMPGWAARALPGGEALEDVLAEAVSAASEGVPPSLRALEQRTILVGRTELTVAVADRPGGWTVGLAGIAELGPMDGMLFVFPEPIEAAFTNRGTAIALDLGLYDSAGVHVSTVRMPACASGPCTTFPAAGPFRYALEVAAGRLDPGEWEAGLVPAPRG
jgi:uncharacterized membrane protein (UPF0127 family)